MVSTAITTLIIGVLSFGSSAITARVLGPHDRGLLAAYVVWPALLFSFLQISLNEGISYCLATARAQGSLIAATRIHAVALTLTMVIAIAASLISPLVVVLFLQPLISLDDAGLAIYASLFCFLATLDLFSAAVLQGKGNFRLLNILRLVQPTVYMALLIAIVFMHTLTKSLTLIAILVSSCVSICVGILLVPPPKPTWDTRSAVTILRVCRSLHLANTFFYISNELDKLLALTYGSPTSAGLYVVAQSLATMIVSIALPAANLYLVPRIAAAGDKTSQFEILRIATTFAAIIVLLFVLLVGSASPFVVEQLLGAKFMPALELVYILLIGNGAKGLRLVLDRCLRGCGFFQITMWGELIVVSVQILGILMCSGSVTTFGVAVMFGVSQILGLVAMIAAFKVRASTLGISGALVDIKGAWALLRRGGKVGPARNDAQ